jgi:hypothetical protein
MAFRVHACDEKHDVTVDSEVQSVGEAPLNQNASRPAMEYGKGLRVNKN